MNYRHILNQEELRFIFENAKVRTAAHPDIAKKHQKVIDKCSFYKSEKEALQAAIAQSSGNICDCQIWAKIVKEDDVYRVLNYWLLTDDVNIKQSAEYIGMAQMYDATRLLTIVNEEIPIDDVIAYF